ncbi:alpha/beta fold hydrolase [Aureispira anguillae]|uniref:Alpha/beta hydrolase n=1 Tax=Aureispira anguillae TaxID=2864201 RepID=A0A916DV77_9BACT|nr:alpha/beta hydrolase [Aureispira anguillae]BDS12866.1 alpha/beta hydrolase [Aureispira anguillae]
MKASKFKTKEGQDWLADWNQRLMKHNQLDYQAQVIETVYGKTHVWTKSHEDSSKPALLFLPGFRTCGLFWDLNQTLAPFYKDYRIYLVDVIGQPSLSSGKTPAVKGDGYGNWLKEVIDGLKLEKVIVAGASFGGQLMLKLAKAAPERVSCLIGFNPVGIQYISLGPRAMWYNALHMLFPSNKNIDLYLEKMVLDPALKLKEGCREFLSEYQYYVIQNFKFGCDYPYKFSDKELSDVKTPVYLILCEDDHLVDAKKTVARAKKILPNFKKAFFWSKIGHGIEVAPQAYESFAAILEAQVGK